LATTVEIVGQAPQMPLGEIIAYVRQNVARRVTLGELASLAELSVFQLTRAFRREAATTPYRLVVDLRVDHARTMLSQGASIADAAHSSGFADQSHFTRHFRRRLGMTPKQYIDSTMTRATLKRASCPSRASTRATALI
jgi:transcriptional regulator GlxA family with amidase domain